MTKLDQWEIDKCYASSNPYFDGSLKYTIKTTGESIKSIWRGSKTCDDAEKSEQFDYGPTNICYEVKSFKHVINLLTIIKVNKNYLV